MHMAYMILGVFAKVSDYLGTFLLALLLMVFLFVILCYGTSDIISTSSKPAQL